MAFSAMNMIQKVDVPAAGNDATSERFWAAVELVSREDSRQTSAEKGSGWRGADEQSAQLFVTRSTRRQQMRYNLTTANYFPAQRLRALLLTQAHDDRSRPRHVRCTFDSDGEVRL